MALREGVVTRLFFATATPPALARISAEEACYPLVQGGPNRGMACK